MAEMSAENPGSGRLKERRRQGWFSWLWPNRRELQQQISAREHAEQALRASEAAYQSLVESLP